jgi:hypothetical protein
VAVLWCSAAARWKQGGEEPKAKIGMWSDRVAVGPFDRAGEGEGRQHRVKKQPAVACAL